MNTEITELFLQNTIEIGELKKLADSLLFSLLFDCPASQEGARGWFEFVDGLEALAKIHDASVLVHDDYIREYLAKCAAIVIQECPEDVRQFVDVDAMIAFGLERIFHKSCVYPEPVADGVSEGTWWYIY